jgi:phage gpG-like protein
MDVGGVTVVNRHIFGISARASDLYPVYSALAEFLFAEESELFFTEGHGEWEPLADSTWIRKVTDKNADSRILHDTLRLHDSLTSPGGDNILEFEPVFRFGTDVPYARFHQEGTKWMPRRKVIDLNEGDRRAIMRAVKRYITRGVIWI